MITRYRNFEEMVESAQRAINDQFEETRIVWLQRLLDILKENKYATIHLKNGNLVDVAKIAYTHGFLSFFDVINHLDYFDSSIEPIITEKLTNMIKYNLYDNIR